jgi:site-specific DNA recombinase
MPARALIYTRVSHDPKGRGRSVEEQASECRAHADREGWRVVAVMTDNDRSASRYAKGRRPEWERTKAAIEAGDVDVLVTWEASRTTRDLAVYTELRDLCSRHGVRWAYRGKVFDFDRVEDRYDTGRDALDAEREAGMTSERVRRAIRANALAGRPHGKRLYGYRRLYDERTGELVGQEPDPDEAPLIREAARRFLAGESARSIANDFNDRGVPTPHHGTWDLTRIRRILTNPAYNAQVVHRGEIVGPAQWDAILDDDTFQALAARFADPSRRSVRRAPKVRLLSGIARCGVCGAAMRYAKQGGYEDRETGRRRNVRYTYSCSGNHCTARDLASLEAFVTAVVLERLSRPDARASLIHNGPDPAAVAAMEQAAELSARLEDAIEQFTAGKLSATTLAKIEDTLRPQIADAERRSRVAGLPTVAADIAAADDPMATWDALADEQKREVIRALMEVVVLPVTVRGRRGFDPDTVRIEWRR